MDDADLAELRMLRARAYGPSADIHSDPAALQRLNELEAAARTSAPAIESAPDEQPTPGERPTGPSNPPGTEAVPPHPGPPPPLPPDLRRAPLSEPVVRVAGESAAAARRRVAPRRWQLSRGFAVLWLVSLVAVAAVAGGVGFGAAWISPVHRQASAQQIATLEADPDFAWPSGFMQTDGALGFTFHGMSIISGGANFFGRGADGDGCLVAYSAEAAGDDGSISGPAYTGCGAGPFPATVQFRVGDELPQGLRDAVGDDVALEFVLDGDRVGVFSADIPTPAASAG